MAKIAFVHPSTSVAPECLLCARPRSASARDGRSSPPSCDCSQLWGDSAPPSIPGHLPVWRHFLFSHVGQGRCWPGGGRWPGSPHGTDPQQRVLRPEASTVLRLYNCQERTNDTSQNLPEAQTVAVCWGTDGKSRRQLSYATGRGTPFFHETVRVTHVWPLSHWPSALCVRTSRSVLRQR